MRERREAFRDARLIVIASEDKDTERIYFKALAKEYTNPRVHVHILERSVDAEYGNRIFYFFAEYGKAFSISFYHGIRYESGISLTFNSKINFFPTYKNVKISIAFF